MSIPTVRGGAPGSPVRPPAPLRRGPDSIHSASSTRGRGPRTRTRTPHLHVKVRGPRRRVELPGSLAGRLRRGGGPDSIALPDARPGRTPDPERTRPPTSYEVGGPAVTWSCRESNPGPLALSQVFSGCSASGRFSRPWCSDEHVTNRLSHARVPIASRDATRSASPLDETDDPGRGHSRVCPSPVAVRQRGRSQCACSRHLWVATNVKEMTSRSLPASPESNDHSRNRSAPLELSTRPRALHHCTTARGRAAFPGGRGQPKIDWAHSGWSMNGLRLPW